MAMSSAVTKIETRRMDNKKRLASDSTVRLEAESQRMEERLNMLRKIMSAEKSRREEAGGIHWQKGRQGPLHRRQALPPHAPPPGAGKGQKGGEGTSKKPLRIRILTNQNKGAKGSSKLPSCGQCDRSTASLSCLECVENYCTVCFAKFHQKGALSRHHVKPMVNKPPVNPTSVSAGTASGSGGATLPKTTSILSAARNSSTSTSTAVDSQLTASTAIATDFSTQWDEAAPGQTGLVKTNHSSFYKGTGGKSASGGGSLLEGTYDEAEAAASFQEALTEWRTGGGAHRTSGGVCSTGENTVTMKDSSCCTQSTQSSQSTTAMTTDPRSLRVEFSSQTGVSYFERLMVRRHRVETVFGRAGEASKVTGCLNVAPKLYLEPETNGEESAPERVPSQYNLFYSTEDVGGDVCERTSPTDFQSERPSSSVLIEEMGFTIEETEPKVQASMPEHTKSNGKLPLPTTAKNKGPPKRQDLRRKKPHSAKQQVVTNTSTTKASDAVPSQKLTPGVSRSGKMPEETNVAASVRSAWAESGRQPHLSEYADTSILSTFFLSGVQRSAQPPATTPKSDETTSQAHSEGQFRFASTVWLPDSSSLATRSNQSHPTTLQPMAPVHTPENPPDNHHRNKEQDSDFDINTDLPPPITASPTASDIDGSRIPTRQSTTSACNYYYDSDSSSSESCDNLSLYDIEGTEFEELKQLQDWEERADSAALESLTSELGRITRCQGEAEEGRGDFGSLMQGHHEVADVNQGICGGGEATVGGHSVDVERVMSEFEMYHQQLMENSDQD